MRRRARVAAGAFFLVSEEQERVRVLVSLAVHEDWTVEEAFVAFTLAAEEAAWAMSNDARVTTELMH